MANEPSLGELTYNPNPATAAGDRVVVSDNSQGIKDLIGEAQDKAKYDFLQYQDYNDKLGKAVKDYAVDYSDVNPNHLPDLRKRAGEFYSVLSKNPSALVNPQRDPKGYEDINNAYSKLQTDIADSKQRYAWAKGQEAAFDKTPALRTSQNKSRIQSELAKPLGTQWQPFELDLPPVLDYTLIAQGSGKDKDGRHGGLLGLTKQVSNDINEPVLVPTLDAHGKPVIGKDGKSVLHNTGVVKSGQTTSYDFNDYMDKVAQTWQSNPTLGEYKQPLQESQQRIFENLKPEDQTALAQATEEMKAMAKQRIEDLKVQSALESDSKKQEQIQASLNRAQKDLNITPQELMFRKGMESNFDKTVDDSKATYQKDDSEDLALKKAKLAIDQQNANTARGRLNAQKAYLKFKMSDPKTATDVEKYYTKMQDNLSVVNVDEDGKILPDGKQTFRIYATDIPQNIGGLGTSDKGKTTVKTVQPFVDPANNQAYWDARFYNPTDGKQITPQEIVNNFNKQREAHPNSNFNLEQYIKAISKKGAIMLQAVGTDPKTKKEAITDKGTLATSLKAMNAMLTSKGEENIFEGLDVGGGDVNEVEASTSTTK